MMDTACKEIEDIEEGECSDQEDDPEMCNSASMKESQNYSVVDNASLYRQNRIPQIVINSDQSDQDGSDDDDDDDYHSHGKKTRRFPDDFNQSNMEGSSFINPLRCQDIVDRFRKRRNNIWGAVMTEQMLSSDIKSCGVKGTVHRDYRDVESYDYTIAKEDDRDEFDFKTSTNDKEDIFGEVVDLEREVKKHENRKRKRNIKDRLGPCRRIDQNKPLTKLNVIPSDDVPKVTQSIVDALQEQNIALFTRMVVAIGTEKAIELYNKTLDVENSGGMMINNGFRRRTAGGVYIQLLKTDSSISKEVVSGIFEQDQKKWNDRKKELRKIKRAARKNIIKKEKKSHIDFDRPETPTPPDEFEEELDNGIDVELDALDLPDRPATPEPKDSSDNESADEEDDEEEEDIAVAIARAKAAILKKQKQLSENKIDDDENNVDMS